MITEYLCNITGVTIHLDLLLTYWTYLLTGDNSTSCLQLCMFCRLHHHLVLLRISLHWSRSHWFWSQYHKTLVSHFLEMSLRTCFLFSWFSCSYVVPKSQHLLIWLHVTQHTLTSPSSTTSRSLYDRLTSRSSSRRSYSTTRNWRRQSLRLSTH